MKIYHPITVHRLFFNVLFTQVHFKARNSWPLPESLGVFRPGAQRIKESRALDREKIMIGTWREPCPMFRGECQHHFQRKYVLVGNHNSNAMISNYNAMWFYPSHVWLITISHLGNLYVMVDLLMFGCFPSEKLTSIDHLR